MLRDEDRELIEKHINEVISTDESMKLTDRLLEDPDVQEHLDEQIKMVSILESEEKKELRKVIIDTIDRAPRHISHFQSYWRHYAAACALLIIVASVLFVIRSQSQSPQEKAIAAFSPYPVTGTSRSDEAIDEGLKLYREGNYHEAIDQLQSKADLQDPDNPYNLIIGSAYFQQRIWPTARIYFAPGTRSSDAIIRNEALWNEALTLTASDNAQATVSLRKIAENPGPHQQEAAQLLKVLEAR